VQTLCYRAVRVGVAVVVIERLSVESALERLFVDRVDEEVR
jgi:hypothetical protein